MDRKTLSHKLLSLVSDERFAKIDALATRPNIFRIVGRTFTETWHSMFLGWLLDPLASHGLKDYPLKRFLSAAANPTIQGSDVQIESIVRLASLGTLDTAEVFPNERNQQEYLCSVGRLDVFIENLFFDDHSKAVILIEQKINAPIGAAQCKKYTNWLNNNYPDDFKLMLLIAPEDRLKGTSEDTVGDARWCGIDYQKLHDDILSPLLKHPNLSVQTKPLIAHYIDALRVPINGRKLAVTDEERELAIELFEKHKDAFDAISAALSDTPDFKPMQEASEQKPVLSFKIDKDIIKGNSVPELFHNALKYLLSRKIEIDDLLPYATSSKRYLISKEPVHPGGNKFRAPIELSGYYMEAHKSRSQALKDIVRLFKKLGLNAVMK